MALFCLALRFLRPSRGLHAAPLAVRRDVRDEARARRASRVRRFAARPLPALPSGPGFDARAETGGGPPLPAPRRAPATASRPFFVGGAPVARTEAVHPGEDLARGYYRAHEARRKAARAARSGLGASALREAAMVGAVEVPA